MDTHRIDRMAIEIEIVRKVYRPRAGALYQALRAEATGRALGAVSIGGSSCPVTTDWTVKLGHPYEGLDDIPAWAVAIWPPHGHAPLWRGLSLILPDGRSSWRYASFVLLGSRRVARKAMARAIEMARAQHPLGERGPKHWLLLRAQAALHLNSTADIE